MTTEILSIDEIAESQASKYVTHNTGLRQIEGQTIRVLSRTNSGPPASPTNGDTYIVDSAAGDWSSASVNDIAHYYSGAWHFYTPMEGLRLWVNDEDLRVVFNGTSWVEPNLGILTLDGTLELTISGGAVTAAQTLHRIDTEGDAGSDELDTISGGTDGMVLMLRIENSSRIVTLKHGTGNLELRGKDITIDDTDYFVILIYDGTLSKWVLAGGGAKPKPEYYSSTMTDNETFTDPGTPMKVFAMDPNGSDRNFDPSGSFNDGFMAVIINSGSANTITFDSTGAAEVISAGSMIIAVNDNGTWKVLS
ncbi:DUF2793 domain-containing protein [Thermodesulfobacteriota bacterium]